MFSFVIVNQNLLFRKNQIKINKSTVNMEIQNKNKFNNDKYRIYIYSTHIIFQDYFVTEEGKKKKSASLKTTYVFVVSRWLVLYNVLCTFVLVWKFVTNARSSLCLKHWCRSLY